MDSGIGSLESIPRLLKRLQIRVQATLASGIGSLELIPGLLKHLKIRAQATLATGIGSLKSIPRRHNMKNEDEDDFFGSKRIYLSLNYQRDEEQRIYSFLNYRKEGRQTKVFVP